MESLLTLIGMVFSSMLVLSAAVESVVETARGLAGLVTPWFASRISVEEAMSLTREFAPSGSKLPAQARAIEAVAAQFGKQLAADVGRLKRIQEKLAEAGVTPPADIIADLNEVTIRVGRYFAAREQQRIILIRFVAGLVGIGLVWLTDFQILAMIAEAPEAAGRFNGFPGLKSRALNMIVGGLGAAAGSSYWHDKLDKVRALKTAAAELSQLGSPRADSSAVAR